MPTYIPGISASGTLAPGLTPAAVRAVLELLSAAEIAAAYLPIAGGTMAGNLDMDHYQISNVQAIDSDEITLNGLPVASEQYASNASNLSTGTVPDARLSSNVPLKNAANTFSGTITVGGTAAVNLDLRNASNVQYANFNGAARSFFAGGDAFAVLIDGTSRLYNNGVLAWNSGSVASSGTIDVSIRRNATGPTFETRADGGLKVCNVDGSALAAVVCSNITVGDNFGSSGKVTTGVGLDWGVGFGNRGTLGAFADGIFGFRTLATTAGFLIDCTTDGTAKLRNRSNTADGSLNLANLTASGNINAGFVANTPEQSNIAGTKLGSTGNGPWIRGSGEAAYTISRTNSQTSASLYFYSFSNETVQVFGRLGIGGIIQAPQSFLTAASNTLSLWQSDGTTAGNLNLATLTASGNITAIHLRGTALWIGGGTNSRIYGPASGKFSLYNSTELAGVGLDVTTDGTLAVRTKAHNADASLTAANITASGLISCGTYTVATLPSAAANAGRIAQVTDSSVTTNGSTVAGGGSSRVLVYSNGSSWDVVVA